MQKIDDAMFYDFCVLLFDQEKLVDREDVNVIHSKLSSFIKKHLDHDVPKQYTNDILYLMAALADEIFLNLDWKGKQYWEEHMLEYEFFKTQIAGDLIFSRINEVIENRAPAEVAQLYLYTLAFGFLGKYRSEPQNAMEIRIKLYDFVEKSKKILYRPNQRLFAEQYNYTLPTMPRKLLPDSNLLMYICATFCFVFLVLGSIVWMLETKELKDLMTEISLISLER